MYRRQFTAWHLKTLISHVDLLYQGKYQGCYSTWFVNMSHSLMQPIVASVGGAYSIFTIYSCFVMDSIEVK